LKLKMGANERRELKPRSTHEKVARNAMRGGGGVVGRLCSNCQAMFGLKRMLLTEKGGSSRGGDRRQSH